MCRLVDATVGGEGVEPAVFDRASDRACLTHAFIDCQPVALNLSVVHAQMLDELVGHICVERGGSFVVDIDVGLLCRHR